MILELKQFSLAFDDLSLFEQVDLSFAKRSIHCLQTGVLDGGSSFLKAIAGINLPTEGDILIEGESISEFDDDKLFRSVNYCYEAGGLVSLFTIYNNIALPMKYHKSIPSEQIAQRIHLVAEQLQIESLLEVEPHQLNDVQMRLVNLARALVVQPKIILADEIQSGMSPEIRDRVLQTLIQYKDTHDALILMTTTAGDETDFADTCLRINNKKVISD